MSGHTVQIEKLSKENFDTWKLQMEAILIKNDYWPYVNGTTARPVAVEENPNVAAISAWDKADSKARADIILSMSPSELCHVKYSVTSNEVWRKLEEVYHSKGPARKATLLKQLLFTKMRDGENMMDHLNNFFGTVDKLKEMEILVAEDLLAILLLYSIPDSYKNFRCAIEARDELPSAEALKIKLHEEYNARKEKYVQKEQHSQGTFHVKSFGNKSKFQKPKNESHKSSGEQNGNSSGFNNQRRKYKCNYCHKPGHKASECWSKSNKQSSSNAEEAFTAIAFSEPEKIKIEDTKTEKYENCASVEVKASLTIAMSAEPTTSDVSTVAQRRICVAIETSFQIFILLKIKKCV